MKKYLLATFCVVCPFYLLFATADSDANQETQTLLFHLKNTLAGDGILMGHQNDLVSGIKDDTDIFSEYNSWSELILKNIPSQNVKVYNSDIFRVCGDYAAVHGFDIGRMEMYPHTNNIDWYRFSFIRQAIIDAYGRKGISTITWHMFNPKTYEVIHDIEYTDSIIHNGWVEYTDSIVIASSGHYGPWIENNDPEEVSPFPEVLTEGTALNDTLNNFLTIAGDYFKSLTTKDTIPVPTRNDPDAVLIRDVTVPIIFRPFHELNGGSFWWGVRTCTDEEYIALWRYMFHYLTNTLDVHNLLFCWSPYGKQSAESYLQRYPGDEYVDILGFEYNNQGMDFYYADAFNTTVDVVYALAQAKDKPFALCENGIYEPTFINAGPTYFTDYFNWIYEDNEARNISYILFWRNYGDEFKVPYPGSDLASNFKEMYDIPHLAKFESDLKDVVFNYALGPFMLHPDNFPTRYGINEKKTWTVSYVNDCLKVKTPVFKSFTVEIFSVDGTKKGFYKAKESTFMQHLRLKAQVYIIKLTTPESSFTCKIKVN